MYIFKRGHRISQQIIHIPLAYFLIHKTKTLKKYFSISVYLFFSKIFILYLSVLGTLHSPGAHESGDLSLWTPGLWGEAPIGLSQQTMGEMFKGH